MNIKVTKDKQNKILPKLNNIKRLQDYQFSGYDYSNGDLLAPSSDLDVEVIMDITRTGAEIEDYEVWFEIPDVNIGDNVPAGVSFETYFDDQEPPVEQTRTWADLTLLRQGTSNSIRYWQPSNNGLFIYNDIEIIKEAGFNVYGKSALLKRLNKEEYSDILDPEYESLETIPYIDENWQYAYFDMVAAYLTMKEIFEAKGIDDITRWAACTEEEKEILIQWNIATLALAETFSDPAWSEERKYKEFWRKYRVINLNLIEALTKRFNDWYGFLNMLFTDDGLKEFAKTWEWGLREEYIYRYLRVSEVPQVNVLVDYSTVELSTYTKGEIGGTLSIVDIVAYLDSILTDKEYFI